MTHPQSFTLASLGCPKNRVDSERILAAMTSAGFAHTNDPRQANVVIVNSCAFIEPAAQESIDTVLDYREENPDSVIVVAGCLPLRYGEDLKAALTEADLFIVPEQIDSLPDMLRVVLSKSERSPATELDVRAAKPGARILTTPGYGYLRIAEGCGRNCRYCTIPSIRGRLRSTDPDRLVREAEELVSQGLKELILVAQDLTAYGMDRAEKNALTRLVDQLGGIEGIHWLRLMYLHPDGIPRDLPRLINESTRVLPYLDIPIQHISAKVLRAMGRPWKGDRIRRLIDRLRNDINGLVLRTTLMVGYPTEGEKEFQELREFLEAYEIERVGIFTYSPEEGTPAYDLGDPVPEEIKLDRADQLAEIHAGLTRRRNRQRIGSTESCIVEGIAAETDLLLQGRTWDQAPEIDGALYITSGNSVPGEIRRVVITGAHGPDLFGKLVESAGSGLVS